MPFKTAPAMPHRSHESEQMRSRLASAAAANLDLICSLSWLRCGMAGAVLKGMPVQPGSDLDGYLRHITACRNAQLPGERVAFGLGTTQVGWVAPRLADALAAFPDVAS